MRCQLIVWGVGAVFLSLNPMILPAYSQPTVPAQKFFHLGCLTGYPDGTFRGEQPVSRYEFVAALNACLEAIPNRSQPNFTSEDLAIPTGQLEEFRQQLDQLRNQLNRLEPETKNFIP